MAGTFEILARFLEKYGDEVEGRQLTELPEETRTKLTQLAHGALEPAARTELLVQLSHNPDWVAWLAQEVKSLRGAER
jgi:hypothetical protein